MIKQAFTLVETLITLVIIGLLAVVLTQAYLTITKVAFVIEQEKHLSEEALMLTQILQSITEEATIAYDKYASTLSASHGFVGTLYLTGGQRTGTSIFSSGNCLPLEGGFLGEDGRYGDPAEQLFLHSGCNLYLQREGQEKVPLIASNSDVVKNVVPSQVSFRIIPFDSENNYFSAAETTLHLNDVAKPGVWVFLHLYSPFYQPLGQNQIDQPLQLFFNLNAPLPSTLTL